jgi:putative FmdB family regulatory protein
MPVYSYRCGTCGLQFDRQQKFSDQPLVRCPECGKKSLHKVYAPVGIVFKGSGFYATDHHSPSGVAKKHSQDDMEEKKDKSEEKEPKPEKNTEKAAE